MSNARSRASYVRIGERAMARGEPSRRQSADQTRAASPSVFDPVEENRNEHPVADRRLMAQDPKLPGKDDIDACRRCPLWERATQGVAGEGGRHAPLMLVGEQPGDQEDLQGKPFVGPAGMLLRRMLAAAGIGAHDFYLTNAVKHFSWEPRGKRRIHKTPAQREIAACSAWLDGEVAAVRPHVVVAMGVTALGALLGTRMTLTAARTATLRHASGATIIVTFHPSALLRERDDARRHAMEMETIEILKRAAKLAHSAAAK
jgi:uracil-DNA glycosylase